MHPDPIHLIKLILMFRTAVPLLEMFKFIRALKFSIETLQSRIFKKGIFLQSLIF